MFFCFFFYEKKKALPSSFVRDLPMTMLLEERRGATVVLTMHQPARKNALAMPMRVGMIEAIERIEADDTVRTARFVRAGTSVA
jgi:enoyl-CoA hydratase/carnithine racemase